MIDGIKAQTSFFNPHKLKKKFDFKYQLVKNTGEFLLDRFGNEISQCSYKGLKLILLEGWKYNKLTISGSLHKYWNNGEHNYNDFSQRNIKRAIIQLCKDLELDYNKTFIHNIEFGLNIHPPIRTKRILTGMKYYRGKFKNYDLPNSNYYQCTHTNFIIKAYDKALHYKLDNENIFRFEVKFIKMNDLKTLIQKFTPIEKNITLRTLYDPLILKLIGDHVIDYWSRLIYFDDTIQTDEFSKNQIIKLLVWQNNDSWENFSKQKRLREKTLLRKLSLEYSDNIQDRIKVLLDEKFKELLSN